jgi:hypothetical protein
VEGREGEEEERKEEEEGKEETGGNSKEVVVCDEGNVKSIEVLEQSDEASSDRQEVEVEINDSIRNGDCSTG